MDFKLCPQLYNIFKNQNGSKIGFLQRKNVISDEVIMPRGAVKAAATEKETVLRVCF